jgi:hypothetical protein
LETGAKAVMAIVQQVSDEHALLPESSAASDPAIGEEAARVRHGRKAPSDSLVIRAKKKLPPNV